MNDNLASCITMRVVGFLIVFILPLNAMAKIENCLDPHQILLTESVTMIFCKIPSAKGIRIGSEDGEPDELPVVERDFKDFYLGQFEVSQLQYRTVMDDLPWKRNGRIDSYVIENDNHPAVCVTYAQAKEFATKLSRRDRTAKYRLPTEAEWEYAARAGTGSRYYWGDRFSSKFVYYSDNSQFDELHARDVKSCPDDKTEQPGYCANPFGLMHMLGNVWELVEDTYVDNYEHAPQNGHTPVLSEDSRGRVIRGGSWRSIARDVRSATRNGMEHEDYFNDVGFRLVRAPR